MDLRQLEAFVSIASLRSFRAAAAKLHVTQPAVSSRIFALEAELGSRLFDRRGRRVRLTGKGVELLGYAENVLRLSRAMVETARGPTVAQRIVRIGATGSLVHSWIPKLVERLRSEFPLLDVELHIDGSRRLRSLLLAGEIDLALAMGPVDAPQIRNVPLCPCHVLWVASPLLDLPQGTVPLDLVVRFPIMTYSKETATYRTVQQLLQSRGLWPVRLGGSNSTEAILRIAEAGIAVGVVVAESLGGLVRTSGLRVLKIDARLPRFEYMASYRFGSQSNLAETIVDLAQEVCRQEQNPRRTARARASQPAASSPQSPRGC